VLGTATFLDNFAVEGSINCRVNLAVGGNTDLYTLTVDGPGTFDDDLTVIGPAIFRSPVALQGDQASLVVESFIETYSSFTAVSITATGPIFTNASVTSSSLYVTGDATIGDLTTDTMIVTQTLNFLGPSLSITSLTVQDDVTINGHLIVEQGITWNGPFTASEVTVTDALTVGGGVTTQGAATINGQLTTKGPVLFYAQTTIQNDADVSGALSVGGTATVGALVSNAAVTAQSVNVANDLSVTANAAITGGLTAATVTAGNTIIAANFCYPDGACLSKPNNTNITSTQSEIQVFSENVTLGAGEEKIIFVGTFTKAEIKKMDIELTPTDNDDDDSYGFVDSNFIFSIKNKKARPIQETWNGGQIENGSVWVRLLRYDTGKPLHFICTIIKSQ